VEILDPGGRPQIVGREGEGKEEAEEVYLLPDRKID